MRVSSALAGAHILLTARKIRAAWQITERLCRNSFAKGRGDNGRRFLLSKHKNRLPPPSARRCALLVQAGDTPPVLRLPPSFPIGSPIAREQEQGSCPIGQEQDRFAENMEMA